MYSQPSPPPGPRFAQLPVPGGTLRYTLRGGGEPVVFVHGHMLDARAFLPQLDDFAARHRVLLYDLRGHGGSSAPLPESDHVGDLEALLDAVGFGRVTLVAHSMGGAVAIDFALRHPERVKALVLSSPMLQGFTESGPLRAIFRAARGAAQSHGPAHGKRLLADSSLYLADDPSASRLIGAMMDAAADEHLLSPGEPGYRYLPSMAAHLHRLRAPTLVLTGAHELLDFEQIAAAIVAGARNARWEKLPCGHLQHLEQPARFNERVLSFLEAVTRDAVQAPHAAVDRAGLPLTTGSPMAAARYREAIERIHAGQDGTERLLDEALSLDPAFALAHVARAMVAARTGDRATAEARRESALLYAQAATAWERGHVGAVCGLLDGAADALAAARAHLSVYPRDLVVLSMLASHIFFDGGPGKRREVLALMRQLAPAHGGDWAFWARLGFHTSEAGHHREAKRMLTRALRARPDSPYLAHALAHVYLEAGRRAKSYRFLAEWTRCYSSAGPLHGHIRWHLAVAEVEAGRFQVALQRHRAHILPWRGRGAASLALADVGGLLMRLRLAGVSADALPRAGVDELLEELKLAHGRPFVALHAAAALAALDDDVGLERCLERIGAHGRGAQGVTARTLGRALQAWSRGEHGRVLGLLCSLDARAREGIGGSNAERALVEMLHRASADACGAEPLVPPRARAARLPAGAARVA